MNEEQKEKWYNAFTREQLIERCEYLQRSCERKEEQITYLDDENFDLENEIERLTISLQAQEELTMNWYNKVKKARDLFYEKCRISQNGTYIFNEVDYEELSNILGSEKE